MSLWLANESMACAGGSKAWPYTCSKVVSPQIQAKHLNEYTPEERAKMGRHGTENCPSKVTKHFFLLLDGKLTRSLCCSGYVIFWLRDRTAKFKTHQIKKYSVFAEITKFNARWVFPLYGMLTLFKWLLPDMYRTHHRIPILQPSTVTLSHTAN